MIYLHRLEDGVLALLLLTMIALAALQITLRNFFDTALIWIDPLLSILVLWLALLGALAASRNKEHLVIDVVSQWLPILVRRLFEVLACVATAIVSGVIAWYAVELVRGEMQFPATAFASVPVWVTQLVIPFAFAGIALRYVIHAFRAALSGDEFVAEASEEQDGVAEHV